MADGSRFTVEDPRFKRERPLTPVEIKRDADRSDPPPAVRSPVRTCLVGCLITLVILGGVVAVGIWWVSHNWREVASALSSEAIKNGIAATELPEAEKHEIFLEIDRLADEFREGRISADQLRRIFESIKESPLMTTIAASAIEHRYIVKSGLGDDEKREGVRTVRRFLHGIVDGKINQQQMDDTMQHVAVRNDRGDWEIPDQVLDAQLRNFFISAREAADAAGVPAETPDIDPSDEFKRIIDEAIQAK